MVLLSSEDLTTGKKVELDLMQKLMYWFKMSMPDKLVFVCKCESFNSLFSSIN